MIFHVRDALIGLGLYAAVCLLAIGTGNGLLKLLRVRLEENRRFFLAPVLTLVFWALLLGLAGGTTWPLKRIAPWIWGATLVLFGYGCIGRPRVLLPTLPFLLLCALLPVLGMIKAFAFGLTEYAAPLCSDGWNYIAGAQYLWEFGRNKLDGLPIFYDSGIYLLQTRYISYSLIAFFSCLRVPGETIYQGSFHQAFSLYCAASAVYFFWLTQHPSPWRALAGTAVTILCGWILRIVWFANFDNGLFLFFMPALAGVVAVMPTADNAYRLLVGLLIAAGCYIYPECLPVGLAAVGLFSLPRLWQERRHWRAWLATGCTAAVVTVVLLLPAAAQLLSFLQDQLQEVAATNRSRGGEGIAPSFFVPHTFLETLWSLTGMCTNAAPDQWKRLYALGLTLLFAAGAVQLLRQRRWCILLCVGCFGAGTAHMLLRAHYDYGAYKILNLGWWCIVVVLVAGAEGLIALRFSNYFRPVVMTGFAVGAAGYAYISQMAAPGVRMWYAAIGLLAGAEWLVCWRLSRYFPAVVVGALLLFAGGYAYLSQAAMHLDQSLLYTQRLSDFRKTKAIRRIVDGEPVLDASDEWLNSIVARYNFRTLNVYPLLCRGITRFGPIAAMRDARTCSPDTRFFVLDTASPFNSLIARSANSRATFGSYTVWELGRQEPGATVVHVENPYGVEVLDQLAYIWMGPDKTTVCVLATHDDDLLLDCSLHPGPCLPGQPARTLRITDGLGRQEQQTVLSVRRTFAIPVRAGLNRIGLEVLDKPALVHASAADWRTLMLHVVFHGAQLRSREQSSSLTSLSGPAQSEGSR